VRRTARRLRLAALLVAGLAVFSGGACARPFRFPPASAPEPGFVAEGVASWYGPGYHGRRTSSGEVFDQEAMTGAHVSFAFGTQVRVTLLSTGRSVIVRINDRFPAYKGRVIDLSRAAARRIGLIGPGTGFVRMEVVR